jgi:hypothetical protein
LQILADDQPDEAWNVLQRPGKPAIRTAPRAKPPRVKQAIVEQRGFQDIRLVDEWVEEFEYQLTACRREYRIVVVRKKLSVSEPRQHQLFDDYRYFFYIPNEPAAVRAEEIVFSSNDRCDQENVLAQLKASPALRFQTAANASSWQPLRQEKQQQRRDRKRSGNRCPVIRTSHRAAFRLPPLRTGRIMREARTGV